MPVVAARDTSASQWNTSPSTDLYTPRPPAPMNARNASACSRSSSTADTVRSSERCTPSNDTGHLRPANSTRFLDGRAWLSCRSGFHIAFAMPEAPQYR